MWSITSHLWGVWCLKNNCALFCACVLLGMGQGISSYGITSSVLLSMPYSRHVLAGMCLIRHVLWCMCLNSLYSIIFRLMCLVRHVLLYLIIGMCLSIVHIALHLASQAKLYSYSHGRSTSRSPTSWSITITSSWAIDITITNTTYLASRRESYLRILASS